MEQKAREALRPWGGAANLFSWRPLVRTREAANGVPHRPVPAASALGSEVARLRFSAASGHPAHARALTPELMPPGFPGDSRWADASRGQGIFLGCPI